MFTPPQAHSLTRTNLRRIGECSVEVGGRPVHRSLQEEHAAFVHELPSDAISNAAGDNNYVRVQVLTPVNVLNREKQVGVVRELTDIVASAAGDRTVANRTWLLITESPDGGWGINKRSPMQTLSPPPRAEL